MRTPQINGAPRDAPVVFVVEASELPGAGRHPTFRSFPRKRESRGGDQQATRSSLGPRLRGDERLILCRVIHRTQLTANFNSLTASKSCTPPPTRLVV